MSLTIIIIDKSGLAKTLNIKDYKECDLYKKCGFKQTDGFEKRTEWNIEEYTLSIFAKINGKSNMENKFIFPPPIHNELFFGSCAIICENTNLTLELWTNLYEKLCYHEAVEPPFLEEKEESINDSSTNNDVDLSCEDIGSELSEEEYDE
jgi:hypothetical protein